MIQKVPAYEREQVVGFLQDAAAVVDEAGVAPELRGLAFRAAVTLLSQQLIVEQQQVAFDPRILQPPNGGR